MLQDKFFDFSPSIDAAIVLMDHTELDPLLFLAVVLSKLKVSQYHFGLLVILSLELSAIGVELTFPLQLTGRVVASIGIFNVFVVKVWLASRGCK